jgi:hypothetical protein
VHCGTTMPDDTEIRVNTIETTNVIINSLDELNGARATEFAAHPDRLQSVGSITSTSV